MINPAALAFDIDGVFADIMSLFIDIAGKDYNIEGISYNDVICYNLEECLDIDPKIIDKIIKTILDGSFSSDLKPLEGAPEVLTRIGTDQGQVLFVTARHEPDLIRNWIAEVLPLNLLAVDVVATGTFEGKADVLLERNIKYFVEDRLETCYLLKEAGIEPVLFRQPWNRQKHPFIEVGSWNELESIIQF